MGGFKIGAGTNSVSNPNLTGARWGVWGCHGEAPTAACVQCWVPAKHWCMSIFIRSNWHPRILCAGPRCYRIISACTSRPAPCGLHRRSTGYFSSLNLPCQVPQPTSQILDPLHGWESFRAGFGASTWEWLTAATRPRWTFWERIAKFMGNILCANQISSRLWEYEWGFFGESGKYGFGNFRNICLDPTCSGVLGVERKAFKVFFKAPSRFLTRSNVFLQARHVEKISTGSVS